ncbi:helix-turn-helix domain-containing protein [Tsuneonella sp. SYSU-LHT278]|uniref:helix-turn-helix domain-containing protein n=1 Tax=Tsuneonella sediminis TaxID=3416089 RepID=UPI003F7B011D
MQLKTGSADSLGSRIQRARQARGWSLRELGERVGVAKVSVWAWEKDHARPRYQTLERMCQALGVPVAELLDFPVPAALSLDHILADCRDRVARALGLDAACIEIQVVDKAGRAVRGADLPPVVQSAPLES